MVAQDRNHLLAFPHVEVVEVCTGLCKLKVVNSAILDLLEVEADRVAITAPDCLSNQVRIVCGPAHVCLWL